MGKGGRQMEGLFAGKKIILFLLAVERFYLHVKLCVYLFFVVRRSICFKLSDRRQRFQTKGCCWRCCEFKREESHDGKLRVLLNLKEAGVRVSTWLVTAHVCLFFTSFLLYSALNMKLKNVGTWVNCKQTGPESEGVRFYSCCPGCRDFTAKAC